jgi:hypothetical protein
MEPLSFHWVLLFCCLSVPAQAVRKLQAAEPQEPYAADLAAAQVQYRVPMHVLCSGEN